MYVQQTYTRMSPQNFQVLHSVLLSDKFLQHKTDVFFITRRGVVLCDIIHLTQSRLLRFPRKRSHRPPRPLSPILAAAWISSCEFAQLGGAECRSARSERLIRVGCTMEEVKMIRVRQKCCEASVKTFDIYCCHIDEYGKQSY